MASMTVEQLYHPFYLEACEIWQTIDDVCDGSRAVKKAGVTYLPKIGDQTDLEYAAYLKRTVFFGATKRTREALIGMLLRKQPAITLPAKIEPWTRDITMSGLSLLHYIRLVCQESVSNGRSASVIDWNEVDKRPFISFYTARNVVNWASTRKNGRYEISLLTVREKSDVVTDGQVEEKEIFREFQLTDGGVTVRTWEQGEVKKANTKGTPDSEMKDSAPKLMTRKGVPLMHIPAVIHNATHLGTEVGEAPLADIAELNISHYMTTADLENGLHICGLPTFYGTGVDDDKAELQLGANRAWTAKNPQAKFGFIEFTGAGLTPLEAALTRKERQMAILGARLLFDQKKDAEAFETVKMRSISETASLSNVAGFGSVTLTQAMQWFCWWAETSAAEPTDMGDKVSVIINDDFMDTVLEPTMFTALVSAFQMNSISFDTFYAQCSKGELYAAGWTMEQELAAISQRPPATAPLPPPVDPNKTPPGDPEDENEDPPAEDA